MVRAPVKSAPVNDPKNWGNPGAKVRMSAAAKSGTIIIPPGMRSIVRLMGKCMRAVLPGGREDAPLRRARQARCYLEPPAEPEPAEARTARRSACLHASGKPPGCSAQFAQGIGGTEVLPIGARAIEG